MNMINYSVGKGVPVGIALLSVATNTLKDLIKKIGDLFTPEKIYERRRLRDREEENKKLANSLQIELDGAKEKIKSGLWTLSEATEMHDRLIPQYLNYVEYVPHGQYPWAPHNKFDYDSARIGAEVGLAIWKSFTLQFEELLNIAFPEQNWKYYEYKSSSVNAKSISSDLTKLLIPVGLLVGSLLISK